MTGEGWAAVASLAAVLASIAAIAEHCVAMFKRKRREDAVADDKALVSVDGDDTAVDQEPHDGEARRDTRKYAINGAGEYGKSRMVLEVIRRYVCEHPEISYPMLEEVFPPALRGIKREGSHWGCFNRKEDAVALMNDTGRSRHFLNDADIIHLTDGTQIAVSSQWGVGNIHYFIDKAIALGFKVNEVSTGRGGRCLGVFLGAVLISAMLMADTEEVGGVVWTFTITDGQATLGQDYNTRAVGSRTTGALEVPSALGGCPVTSIGTYAFEGRNGLTSVTIPDGVTSIGGRAFANCSGLTSIVIPSSVTTIGGSAFLGCSGLTSLPIPDGVISIGAAAFYGCSSLKAVVMPKGVTRVEDSMFFGCSELVLVTMPETVTSIEYAAFDGCSELTSMTIPKDVTSIGESAFNGCSGLTSVVLPSRFGDIRSLFPSANEIESVVWVDDGSKTAVSVNSCSGLGKLVHVEIPANVMNVNDCAFCDCHKLKSVVFLGNAPDVGTEVFNGTPKDMVISVPANSIGWDGGFTSTALPSTWGGRAIAHVGESYDWSKGTTAPAVAVAGSSVTVSNVVVHYILNSVQPEFAIQPADDMNFVNIITEVRGSAAVAIPETWAASYPGFAEKFGTDFTQALLKPSGKIGTGGTPMLVWQDYVAGTDPTNEKDVFTASITIVDGKVTISYTPELDDARKAMRKYTTWGKTSLLDTDWTEVQEGHEAEYNFFKVSVEMR